MKSNFKYFIITCLFALFCFYSCQDETIQETENPEETIAPNSTVANLMQFTVSNDGSVDNVMDDSNCFSVNLPVTIIVNDITITINTLEDLALIEEIFDEYDDDEDILDFLFPITIILNDYTEIVIENEDQLEAFIEECTEDQDDIIECVDFVYPISFSIYNSDFQLIDTVEINSDEALYEFLDNLEDNPNGAVIASLNYPVSLIYADGSIVEVTSNQELEAAINAAEDECDDDDDEECDLNINGIEEYLLECGIDAEFYTNNDPLDELDFEFLENGDLVVNGEPAVTETGSWEIVETDDGYKLIIEGLETFSIANGYWLLEECEVDDDEVEFEFTQTVNNEIITMELEVDCDEENEECLEDDVRMYLLECYWYSGSNLMDNNQNNGPYNFFDTNEVTIGTNPANNSEGVWDIATTDDGVIIVLTLPEPYGPISGLTWLVVECEEDRIEMVNGDNHLVLERDCDVEEEDPFECYGNYELTACDQNDDVLDGFAIFDIDLIFANCPNDDVEYYFYETLADAESQVNPLVNPYINNANPQTIYSRVSLAGDPNTFEIFEHTLIVEDCSSDGCSEQDVDGYLVECIWNIVSFNGSNDLVIYDMDFEANSGIVVIYTDSVTIDASWSTSQTNDGVIIEFSNVAGANIQAITGEWLVVECTETQLVLHRGDDEIVLERNCN